MSSIGLVWFRNDLRVADNEALFSAMKRHEVVIGLYCFDPRVFGGTMSFGFPKTGPHRAEFIHTCVTTLHRNLAQRRIPLYVYHTAPTHALKQLIKQCGTDHTISGLYYHEEVTDEELTDDSAMEEICTTYGIRLYPYWGTTLYHFDDLPWRLDALPPVFTEFRKHVEKYSSLRMPLTEPTPRHSTSIQDISEILGEAPPVPTLAKLGYEYPEPEPRSVLTFIGGEDSAMLRLQSYLWDSDSLKSYKQTRNGLLGANYSSKFSAWLATGCISPRTIYAEVQRYETERTKNDSTYWLIFELLWRDYFRFISARHGNNLFQQYGIRGQSPGHTWRIDRTLFEKWRTGRTGIPFIDANMRELLHTGFMSNRGRQNVASFLTKDLAIDWRMGAEWFESQLIDYDVCSNYGNWNYVAGIGNDPREGRYFNILKQAQMYDPDGNYVKQWIPELRHISTHTLHQPHTMSHDEQERAKCRIGTDYPLPIIDLQQSAQQFQR
jgi:deoxyribodipyrimidine photo-lyase